MIGPKTIVEYRHSGAEVEEAEEEEELKIYLLFPYYNDNCVPFGGVFCSTFLSVFLGYVGFEMQAGRNSRFFLFLLRARFCSCVLKTQKRV